jgi:hypothetical protein
LPGFQFIEMIAALFAGLPDGKSTKKSGLPDGIFFKPKIPIWVIFGGSCNGRCWHILLPFGLFYGY